MINLLKKFLSPASKSYENNDYRKINNFNILLINLLLFLILNVALRIFFLYKQSDDIVFSISEMLKLFSVGVIFDVVFFSYFLLIPTLYSILSYNISHRPINRIIVKGYYLLMIFVILFGFVSEVIFWDEFQSRFNFIAVDYLIYTTEVINNIVESYPVYKVLLAIMMISMTIFIFVNKKFNFYQSKAKKLLFFKARSPIILIVLTIIAIDLLLIDSEKNTEISQNQYINEIAKNGPYQLFSAYRNNEINFSQLYQNIEQKDALNNVRSIIAKQEKYSKFINDQDLSRLVSRPQSKNGEKKYNIMLVVEESLSADFMEYFGNKDNITPNLDKLAKESLFFTNLKATGTRTVRGLEAISLSIPPTPGNSIVRRKNNDNLFNIASPLKLRGYQAKFIYGGDGYFDNMNDFFFNNGFEIVDRGKFDKEEISFSNAWGVADEDLFDRTIKEADKSYNNNKNFINLILTTSNHRPFTYPDGKIDIASKTNRSGAVKYADYAVGKFIEKAKKKKWFDNTIFVIIADHCAGSAGNTDVPIWRYQIPAIFYAPKIINKQIFSKNISQIDIAPTILGILNLQYLSKFFGTDVLNNNHNLEQYSFVSTYTDTGYLKNSFLYLLSPKKSSKIFTVNINKFGYQGSEENIIFNSSLGIANNKNHNNDLPKNGLWQDNMWVNDANQIEIQKNQHLTELENAISFYQTASYLYKNQKLKDFTKEELAKENILK